MALSQAVSRSHPLRRPLPSLPHPLPHPHSTPHLHLPPPIFRTVHFPLLCGSPPTSVPLCVLLSPAPPELSRAPGSCLVTVGKQAEGRNQWISHPEYTVGKQLEIVLSPPQRHASPGPQNVASFENPTMSLLMALGAHTSMTNALKGDAGVEEEAVELDGHGGGLTLRPRDTKSY